MCKLIGRHVILKICVHSKFLFKYLLASLFSHGSSLEYTQKQKEEIPLQTYKEFEQLEKEKKKKRTDWLLSWWMCKQKLKCFISSNLE